MRAMVLRLEVDRVSAEVIGALRARGVECVLLKGPAVATWLYGDGSPRPYVDTDILVAPDRLTEARRTLANLGFVTYLDDSDTPGWRQAAHHYKRAGDRANVDLHRTLIGVGVGDDEVWSTLAADTEPLSVGGTEARIPALPARTLHLALHAAQHGARPGKHREDLARGLELIDPDVWRSARGLAERLGALEAFAAGLRSIEAGERLADELALPDAGSVETVLLAGRPVAGALGWNDLANTSGFFPRFRIIVRKAIPTRRFMRAWSPLARRGPLGMAAAYIVRPVWLVGRMVPGYLAWRRARRVARR